MPTECSSLFLSESVSLTENETAARVIDFSVLGSWDGSRVECTGAMPCHAIPPRFSGHRLDIRCPASMILPALGILLSVAHEHRGSRPTWPAFGMGPRRACSCRGSTMPKATLSRRASPAQPGPALKPPTHALPITHCIIWALCI